MHEDMQSMYLMDWDKDLPETEKEHTKLTIAPDATNKLLGAQRLLVSREPQFSMPVDQNDPEARAASSWMEQAARLMWLASGRLGGLPVENDVVLAALTFGECQIGLVNLAEQLESLPDGATPAEKARLEDAVMQTPIMFDNFHPVACYSSRDRLGLVAHLKRYTVNPRQLSAEWPGVDFDYEKRTELVVCDWYDLTYRVVWIEGEKLPFVMRKHELPFIPVVSQITEGSQLFTEPEDQVRPFLYTLWKSGLDKRMNLALTALFTNIFAIASNAQFRHITPPGKPDKTVEITFNQVGGVLELEAGESFEPMLAKGAIDPALLEAIEICKAGITESTIYDQALGEPLGANAPFSMVALLHQAGRLPLASPQKLAGWAIAHAMELAFKWIKANGENITISYKGEKVEIIADQIPDHFVFDVTLEVDLPQDKLQQANVSGMLKEAKLASKRWIRENILSVGDSENMDEEIWSEDFADLLTTQLFQQLVMAEQAEKAAQAQAQSEQRQGGGASAGSTQGGLVKGQRVPGQPQVAPQAPGSQGEQVIR